ncbi:unnamed protein product (macronuclear) [Paramecium tetraurelia]|uniref:Uncharacterized protein n=1 Tax=Paramecium tetraurelia TaxID=5888 RepID=A0BYT0_PARTE|nr:uncharacterized protein GSPATT00033550001 [Paramecium tetraurelia]CAK63697.1 unnamed protein product [Paramecium tetraurelia]|eukprot:XP_001431095.1 hypothetical protein (macronuclear) [Paramecium tetraurelia strain d4-2]
MGDQFYQLCSKWTVSEKYNASLNVDYKKTIVDVCSFNTIEEFAYLMKKTIYSKLSDVLSEPQKCKIFKQFNDEVTDVQIEAIQFFKNDIKPWWEDESNKNGGEIQFDIPTQFYNIYDNLYQDILYEVIGQSNEDLRHINGLRVVDKINAKQGNRIRIELWLDIDPKDKHDSILKLDEWLVSLIQKYHIEQTQLTQVSHKK